MLLILDHGIVFIGPPPSAMRALGDKIASSIVAQSALVPTLDWSGSGIVTSHRDKDDLVSVPNELYQEACCPNFEIGFVFLIQLSFTLKELAFQSC